MKREATVIPFGDNIGPDIGVHTSPTGIATGGFRHEKLQIVCSRECPTRNSHLDEMNTDIGAGFLTENSGLGWTPTNLGTDTPVIVKSIRITSDETRPLVNGCNSLAKFTEKQFDPLECGTLSMGHPILYTGEMLSKKERMQSPKLDPSEGNVRYPGAYFGGHTYRVCDFLMYCTSIVKEGEQLTEGHSLYCRFAEEGYDTFQEIPYANAEFFAMELGLLFTAYGMDNRECMAVIAPTNTGCHQLSSIVNVVHGPVLYVEDRDEWLNARGIPSRNPSVMEDIVMKFVKPLDYVDEREYRFCIQPKGRINCKQLILPTGQDFHNLFTPNVPEKYWTHRREGVYDAMPMEWKLEQAGEYPLQFYPHTPRGWRPRKRKRKGKSRGPKSR